MSWSPLGIDTTDDTGTTDPTDTGISPTSTDATTAPAPAGTNFLPAVDTPSTLSGDTATQLGVAAPDSISGQQQGGIGSALSSVTPQWIQDNPGAAGLLGLAGYTAARQPSISSAAQTQLNNAAPSLQQAQTVINAGGATGSAWAGQKAAIDASAAQQLQQQSEAIKQSAANTGQSGMVVQQQLNQLQQQIATQTQAQ